MMISQLIERGVLHRVTHDHYIGDTIYLGIDPTADSLHVGHLLPLNVLRLTGKKIIILIGERTAKIGDPTGKSGRREAINIDFNSRAIAAQIGRILPDAKILTIHTHASFDDFAKISANKLLSLKSIKDRIGSDLTVAEMLYPIEQAIDFVSLAKKHRCYMQLGGQDQWGNIVTGIDLGRANDIDLMGITVPLLETKDGKKFGKTESGTIWLDESKTPSKKMYDFWRSTPDDKVMDYIAKFTTMDLTQLSEATPVERQKALADSIMQWIY